MKGLQRNGVLTCAVLLLSAVSAFAQMAWEGSAVVGRFGDFPPGGLFAASNAFPRNSMVTVTDARTGRQVRVIVVGPVDDPGLFLLLSPEAGSELGLASGGATQVSAAPVRTTPGAGAPVPSPVEPALSPDPDLNPAVRIAELLEETAEDDPEPANEVEPSPAAEVEAAAEPRIAEHEPVVSEPELEPEHDSDIEFAAPLPAPSPTPVVPPPAPAPVADPLSPAAGVGVGLQTASRGISGEQPLPEREAVELRPLEPIVTTDAPSNGLEEALARLRERDPQKPLFPAPHPDSLYTFIEPPLVTRFQPSAEDLARAVAPGEDSLGEEEPQLAEEPAETAPRVELEPGSVLSLEPAEPRPPAPEPEVAAPVVEAPKPEPPADEPRVARYFADSLSDSGFYLQIGAFSSVEGVETALAGLQLGGEYPYTVVPGTARDRSVYRVFVGPLQEDEKGRALFLVRAKGYRDAFVRRGS